MNFSLTKGTVRVDVRRDTAANWTSNNPTLRAGEFGVEHDTGFLKCGDGSTAWTSLGYVNTDKVEGEFVLSTTNGNETVGKFLRADGDGTCSWQIVPASPVEGTAVVSTGESIGKVLTADGDDTSSWQTPASGGETNTASNVGSGAGTEYGVFKQKSGVDLEFKKLKQGSNITLTENASDITIASSGGGGGGGGFILHLGSGIRAGNFSNVTDRYYYPFAGVNYHYWTSYTTTPVNGTHATNGDYFSERAIIIPSDCTIKILHMTYYTSANNTNTYGMSLWAATPSYPTSTVSDCVYSEIGTCSVANDNSYRLNHAENNSLDASLSAGDILQPYCVRTAGTQLNQYIYFAYSIWAEGA